MQMEKLQKFGKFLSATKNLGRKIIETFLWICCTKEDVRGFWTWLAVQGKKKLIESNKGEIKNLKICRVQVEKFVNNFIRPGQLF